jgi:hypothetical protein
MVEGMGIEGTHKLPGLVSVELADQPMGGNNSASRLCPTIEQLLGVLPGQNNRWEWGRF